MTVFTEELHAAGFVVSEANGTRSREQVTLLSGQDLTAGAVLGKQTVGTSASAAALGTNTGNGTFGAIAVAAGAEVGAYKVQFADATHYVVEDPNGVEVGHGAVGVAFNAGGLGFTISAGGTAFAAGDSFTVTVAAGSGKYAVFDPAASDGTENAVAILYADCDASAGDQACTVIAREAEVNEAELVWKTGVTANQQTAALAQLAALGIIGR